MTQTYPSKKSTDWFRIQSKKMYDNWLHTPDDISADDLHDILGDVFTEIDDYLNDYTMDMGN